MIEGPRNATMVKPEAQAAELASDQAVETALAGAAAIQRLVAERNGLRSRLNAQEHELMGLRASNEDLRRRLVLVHQHYVDLAKKIVGQLEQFDMTIREGVEPHEGQRREDVVPISLVQRVQGRNGAAVAKANRS